jgi:hypothetical protein
MILYLIFVVNFEVIPTEILTLVFEVRNKII